jgi:hypothetical protein
MKEQYDGLRKEENPSGKRICKEATTVKVFKLTFNHHAGSSSFKSTRLFKLSA